MYARVNDSTDILESWTGFVIPGGVGPLPPPPEEPGYTYYRLDAPIDWSGKPSETSVKLWNNGAPVWAETLSLPECQARAVDQIDAAGEAMRMAVISKQTQTKEYERAELHAREYRAAGYAGEVPRGVASWTKAKWRDGWTDRQAADDILATAERWYGLLDDIRDARLSAKEDVRSLSAGGPIGARVEQFKAELAAIMENAQ